MGSCHRVAYSALKRSYEKVGDHWEPKGDRGPSDERAKELDVSGRSDMTREELGQAIARNGAPLRVTFEGLQHERPQVWIDDAVLDATQLDRVVPAAAAEHRTASGVTFAFDRGTTGEVAATFDLTGDAVGVVRGRIGRTPDDAVPVSILLYP